VTGCGCLLLVGALVALLAVFIFGSTDPGEPISSMRVVRPLAVLLLSWAAARSMPSRAHTLARS
jgi:hypothetical protein